MMCMLLACTLTFLLVLFHFPDGKMVGGRVALNDKFKGGGGGCANGWASGKALLLKLLHKDVEANFIRFQTRLVHVV